MLIFPCKGDSGCPVPLEWIDIMISAYISNDFVIWFSIVISPNGMNHKKKEGARYWIFYSLLKLIIPVIDRNFGTDQNFKSWQCYSFDFWWERYYFHIILTLQCKVPETDWRLKEEGDKAKEWDWVILSFDNLLKWYILIILPTWYKI